MSHQFLKDEYVLKNKGINKMLLSDLFEEYKEYCRKNGKKSLHKIDFNKIQFD